MALLDQGQHHVGGRAAAAAGHQAAGDLVDIGRGLQVFEPFDKAGLVFPMQRKRVRCQQTRTR